jgi:hypothetical protein
MIDPNTCLCFTINLNKKITINQKTHRKNKRIKIWLKVYYEKASGDINCSGAIGLPPLSL